MMKKRIKTGGALILAAVLAISAFALPKAFAADEVKTTKDCSLTVNVANKGLTELVSGSVTINLYKVADIAVTGEYTELAGFEGVGLDKVSSETTTEKWEEMSAIAATKVTSITEPTDSLKTTAGVAAFTKLKPGMYLVAAQQLLTDYYQYDFTPYLISLPDNRFYQTNDDTWLYDIEVSLKPAKSDRYGDLLIDKTVDVFNETLGEANFVFQVEAEKTDIDTGDVTKVYSNVVSLEFDGTGSKQIRIDDIPAGAVVTVTEVYSGASYQFVKSEIKETAEVGKLVIIADGEEKVAEIDFLNTYNDGLNGGNAVVNEFTYSAETGSYTHTKANDSTTPEE